VWVALGVLPGSAAAVTFKVDSLGDGVDANTADEVCATAGGRCTLRAAIDEANDEPGNDEIRLPRGTIELKRAEQPVGANAEGDLDVTEAVQIDGRGPGRTVIEQTVKDRVLASDAPFSGFIPGLQLADLTLTGGSVGGAGENGGAGLQNNAVAVLANVVVRGNVANSDSADDVPGGGVWSSGVLALADTTVRDNFARGRGETQARGAGVHIQDGSATLQDGSKVTGNSIEFRRPEGDTLAQGAGIFVANPGMEPSDVVSVIDSTVARNTIAGSRDADGGGISAGFATNLELQRSTISDNRSRRGGGLFAAGTASATLDTSTLSGNVAGAGGGAAIFHQTGAAAIDITRTTIAGNEAARRHFALEAGEQAAPGSLALFASIVFNPGRECGPADEAVAVQSDGRNVVGDKSCDFDDALFDLRRDPRLGFLADNGGPTRTHALKPASPAIGRVPCAPGIDQRGVPRPQGADCDSGAFERRVSP
jgi:CSLREA domain-containing protein